jgi:hypothetical protein
MDQLLLFAQIGEGSERFDAIGKTVFMVAMAGVGIVIPVVILAWRKTQMAHLERMKAMELGYPLRTCRGPLALYCGVVGASVPHDIWVAPTVVSVVALIGVSIVAGTGFGRSDASAQPQPKTKPAQDPDTVDFAGRFQRH